MSREQVFDTEIKKFFDICVRILESHQKQQILSTENHALRNLQRYKIVYNMTEVETHIPYFQKIFRMYRDDLYDVLKEDKWLMEENLVIQYGEEIEDPELRKRSEKRKIEISTIYKTAVQLRKTYEESVKGLPDSARDESPELTYSHFFLLHLFRIFGAIYPQNKEVSKVVQTLEKELGMNSGSNFKPNNTILDLAENAKKLLGKDGTNPLLSLFPTDLKLPTNDEMANKLQQAMKDPVVNETLGATMSSVMGAKNIGEGISLALKSLENPKFMEGLLKTVNTLIPQETLDVITKTSEQLKDNGEIKNALSSLGLPTELDISQILNEQFSQMKINPVSISDESTATISEQSVNQISDAKDQVNPTESSVVQEFSENTSQLPTLKIAQPEMTNDMLELLKNPNLMQMFNNFQQNIQKQQSQPTSESSLIDF
jgi:hypothetical protein